MGAALTNLKKSWSKGTCLHPEAPLNCIGKPIDSHTLQRGGPLNALAEDGHVLQVRIDPSALLKLGLSPDSLGHPVLDIIKSHKDAGKLEPQRVGMRDASTFPGFCGWHDNSCFAPIEEHAFTCTDEQCFLNTFRPASLELWAKRCKVKTTEGVAASNSSDFMELVGEIDELALNEHLQRKARLDRMLLSRDYSDLHFLVLELDANPGVATAGVFAPEVGFLDEPLQDITDLKTPLQHVSYSIIPNAMGGHVVMGWDGDSPAVERFADSLLALDPSNWPDAILTVAFESIENTYFSQAWWDSLTEIQRMWASLRALTGGMGLRPISYKPDGVGFIGFGAKVVTRK